MSKIIANQISPRSGDNITINGSLSVGGTVTYEDVSNVDSVGIVTAGGGIRIGTGGTIGPVGSGIVTYYGDGSQLTGIDATSLKDSGGTVRVQANTFGVVVTGVLTATSFSGDGSGLTFTPKILAFDPAALSTGVAADKTITITFDQNISFSGNGTVELRSGSAGGSVIQSFAISSGTPATGLSIVGTQLIINPSSDFAANTVVYVILPSTGIVNSVGSAYGGSNTYNFQTVVSTFSAQGGTEFTVADGSSPTGYYKYHVFSQSGILTTTAPAQSASDFDMMIIGGGGGGGHSKDPVSPGPGGGGGGGGAGGYITATQSNVILSSGQYTVSIGSSGLGGYNASPTPNTLVSGTPGGDTTITPPSSPTSYIYRAIGGGGGGGVDGSLQSSGLSGGSGGGGSTPSGPQAPFGRTSGGSNTPGQGNSGAQGASAKNVVPSSPEEGRSAGGGGGAGGTAQAATALLRFYGPTGANPSDIPRSVGGAGGPGTPNPAFSGPKLSSSGLPADILNTIGPSGLYGGGGGGAATGPVATGGEGGSGGGGDGGNTTSLPSSILPYAPSTIAPGPYPSPLPNFGPHANGKGFGGGGGGAYSSGTYYAGSGYPGVVMIRYETPAP